MKDYIWMLLGFAIMTVTFIIMKLEANSPRRHLHK